MRSVSAPPASAMILLIRESVPRSIPLVRESTGTGGRAGHDSRVARIDWAGTASTIPSAPSNASSIEEVAPTASGSRRSPR